MRGRALGQNEGGGAGELRVVLEIVPMEEIGNKKERKMDKKKKKNMEKKKKKKNREKKNKKKKKNTEKKMKIKRTKKN